MLYVYLIIQSLCTNPFKEPSVTIVIGVSMCMSQVNIKWHAQLLTKTSIERLE